MSRIRAHLERLPQFDSMFNKAGLVGIYAICMSICVVIGLGMPTGLGPLIDIIIICLAGLIVLLIANLIVSLLISFIRIRQLKLPRLLLGAFISAFTLLSIALTFADISYWATALLTFVLLMIGYSLSTTVYMMMNRQYRGFRHYCYMFLSILLLALAIVWLSELGPRQSSSADEREFLLDTQLVNALEVNDPAEKGPYTFRSLTYGSGSDRHRDEFGEDVDIQTRTVDGSDLIDRWNPIRKLFWGFGKTELPLNGRVWLPQGEGPFPLVLIVHGNHLMEKFSDEGYAYLGELLASKGFMTVSVDENFINYSVWSGGLSNDMELRSWVILQHIEEIRRLNQLPDNPMLSKVDMSRIALIGHSRGGQAIVLAAEDPNIHDDVKAIIAIAPTDRQEDKEYLTLDHINYLTIQGSQDADVSTFTGDRQYERTTLTKSSSEHLFKSSLYIKGANHGQFNTHWGNMDLSLPTGLLLNKRDIINSNDQRRIAEVYITAFLDITVMETSTYLPMFKDYRKAANWLPATSYRNRYKDSSFIRISNFEEDHNIQTTTITNGSIVADHLDEWKEETDKDRQNYSKHNRSVRLSWTDEEAFYEINLPNQDEWTHQLTSQSVFTFSLANLTDMSNMAIMIEIVMENGVSIQSPLSKYKRIQPKIYTRFTKASLLDSAVRKGRYGSPYEPVLQTYMIPLADLANGDPRFNYKSIQSIRFLFQHQQQGSILLDDIGFY